MRKDIKRLRQCQILKEIISEARNERSDGKFNFK